MQIRRLYSEIMAQLFQDLQFQRYKKDVTLRMQQHPSPSQNSSQNLSEVSVLPMQVLMSTISIMSSQMKNSVFVSSTIMRPQELSQMLSSPTLSQHDLHVLPTQLKTVSLQQIHQNSVVMRAECEELSGIMGG